VRYKKRPTEVEALQFLDNNSARRIVAWANGKVHADYNRHGDCERLYVETLEGDMIARPGWYIIKGVEGEFYPCKETVFEQTYEPVEADDE
jgi:hypothetical protein